MLPSYRMAMRRTFHVMYSSPMIYLPIAIYAAIGLLLLIVSFALDPSEYDSSLMVWLKTVGLVISVVINVFVALICVSWLLLLLRRISMRKDKYVHHRNLNHKDLDSKNSQSKSSDNKSSNNDSLAGILSDSRVGWRELLSQSWVVVRFQLWLVVFLVAFLILPLFLITFSVALEGVSVIWGGLLFYVSSVLFVLCLLLFTTWVLQSLPFLVQNAQRPWGMLRHGWFMVRQHKIHALIVLIVFLAVYFVTQIPVLMGLAHAYSVGETYADFERLYDSRPVQYSIISVVVSALSLVGLIFLALFTWYCSEELMSFRNSKRIETSGSDIPSGDHS